MVAGVFLLALADWCRVANPMYGKKKRRAVAVTIDRCIKSMSLGGVSPLPIPEFVANSIG